MGLELILTFAAGATAISGIIIAVGVFAKIIEIRDRCRATYKFARAIGYGRIPGLTEYPMKFVKIKKGYRIEMYDEKNTLVHSVDLEKVDTSGEG